MSDFFYEEIHRANHDIPYIDTDMTNIQYCAHYHEEIEIVCIKEGAVNITVDGTLRSIGQGDIAIILPFKIHSLETPVHSKLYILKILGSNPDFSAFDLYNCVISPDSEKYRCINGCIYRLIEENTLKDSDPLKKLALRSATDTLLLSIARLPDISRVTKDNIIAQSRDIELLKTINKYLQQHYNENVSLEDAANACHMSMYYFAHLFKKATGTTFLSYLNEFRLEKVRHKITDSSTSFTQIAMQCGFPSIRTFNRCFLKHYKITPTQAREKWRPGNFLT